MSLPLDFPRGTGALSGEGATVTIEGHGSPKAAAARESLRECAKCSTGLGKAARRLIPAALRAERSARRVGVAAARQDKGIPAAALPDHKSREAAAGMMRRRPIQA
jgi:hypothetical protein